jgi:hypothetical protein
MIYRNKGRNLIVQDGGNRVEILQATFFYCTIHVLFGN